MTTDKADMPNGTPRTDAAHAPNEDDYYASGYVDVDFARQLERELITALADAKTARAVALEEAEQAATYAAEVFTVGMQQVSGDDRTVAEKMLAILRQVATNIAALPRDDALKEEKC